MRTQNRNLRSAMAVFACMVAVTANFSSASARPPKRATGTRPQHSSFSKRRVFLRVPQRTGPRPHDPNVPQQNNPRIPMWDGGCGQCGFIG
jgi:hypothetical protein